MLRRVFPLVRRAPLSGLVARLDLMLSDPRAFARNPAEATRLSQQRADLQRALEGAEEEWLELSRELEAMNGGQDVLRSNR